MARTRVRGWQSNDSGRPVYAHAGGRGGTIFVSVNPASAAIAPWPAPEDLWAVVERLSPFTADVALAVLAQLGDPMLGHRVRHPLLQSVTITSDAILRYKGISRWGRERGDLARRVADAMDGLGSLQFDLQGFVTWTPDPRHGRTRRVQVTASGYRLFDVVKFKVRQETLFGSEPIAYCWSVRAGQWAEHWFSIEGRAWLACVARQLLELDHRGAALAKKLGQHLALFSFAGRKTGGRIVRRVQRLLEAVGELPLPEARGKDWAGRTRERFDDALLQLQEADILAVVDWVDGHGPGDPDRERGWVDRWLRTRVAIVLSAAGGEPAGVDLPCPELPVRKSHRRNVVRPGASGFDRALLQRTRKGRSWSQDALARELGITRQYLSLIEDGRRTPSSALVEHIARWLAC